MKIAFLTQSISREAGGLFESVRQTAKTISASHLVEVDVLAFEDLYSSEDNSAWRPLTPLLFEGSGPEFFKMSQPLIAKIHQLRPDLLHVQGLWSFLSIASRQYTKATTCPSVISPRGMLDPWALKNSAWKKVLASYLFEKSHLNEAHCIHSLCTSETRSVRSYGLNNPVCQIPNGIDLPDNEIQFLPPWQDSLEPGKKILLFLSRIHPKKGLIDLILAWENVQKNFPVSRGWTLAIAGWDQLGHENELREQVSSAGLGASVLFLGPQFNENKVACYQNADAFILPSFSEGLPMVILEAWAHKLPVLMTPACNLPEGFAAEAALKIQPEPASIEAGLVDFFSLTELEQDRLGNNGYELVKDCFTWEKVAHDLFSVYQWTLGGGAPPDCVITD